MKVTVIMPTYNDEDYIANSISSVLSQTYENVELIVINDGSTDNTKQEITKFTDSRLIYLEQSNADQLNAILRARDYISGDLVMLLHSDDRLTTNRSIEENIAHFHNNKIDGIYGDLIKIDESDTEIGKITTPPKITRNAAVELLLRLGSNFIPDPFFCTREFFFVNVLKTYVTWNMPYWLVPGGNRVTVGNLIKTDNPWYCYRVYANNYLHSDVGKFVVTNGNLRTVLTLANHFYIPLYRLQRKLMYKLNKKFSIIALPRPWPDRYSVLKNTVCKNYGLLPEDSYLHALLGFYSQNSAREITLKCVIKQEDVLLGKDARTFYKLLSDNNLSPVYHELLGEAETGFKRIVVNNSEQKELLEQVLKFLNIDAEVDINAEKNL